MKGKIAGPSCWLIWSLLKTLNDYAFIKTYRFWLSIKESWFGYKKKEHCTKQKYKQLVDY